MGVGSWISGKTGSEVGKTVNGGVENLNHLNNAGQAGAASVAPKTLLQKAVAIAAEFSPTVKALVEAPAGGASKTCAVIGGAAAEATGKPVGAVVGGVVGTAASGVATPVVGVVAGVAAGQGARMGTEYVVQKVVEGTCNAVVNAATSKPVEPAKPASSTGPAKPVQLTNIPIPGVDDVSSIGRPPASGSMADRLAAQTGMNLTSVGGNTGENRTHHNPNAPTAPQSVVRVQPTAPAM